MFNSNLPWFQSPTYTPVRLTKVPMPKKQGQKLSIRTKVIVVICLEDLPLQRWISKLKGNLQWPLGTLVYFFYKKFHLHNFSIERFYHYLFINECARNIVYLWDVEELTSIMRYILKCVQCSGKKKQWRFLFNSLIFHITFLHNQVNISDIFLRKIISLLCCDMRYYCEISSNWYPITMFSDHITLHIIHNIFI